MGGRRPADQLELRLRLARRRQGEHRGRDHPLRHVVDHLELAVSPGHGQVAGHVEEVEGLLGLRPVPAPVLLVARLAVVEVARRARPARGDLGQQLLGEVVVDLLPPLPLLGAVGRHPVLHHRPQLDRHQRLHVRPVLDQPARLLLGGAGQQRRVVGAHPREQRHVVRPLEHVDRVDLEHAGPLERARERPHRRRGVPRVEEPLRGQRDPAGLGARERVRHDTHSTTTYRQSEGTGARRNHTLSASSGDPSGGAKRGPEPHASQAARQRERDATKASRLLR